MVVVGGDKQMPVGCQAAKEGDDVGACRSKPRDPDR